MQNNRAPADVRPQHADIVIPRTTSVKLVQNSTEFVKNPATATDISASENAFYTGSPVLGVYTNETFSWRVVFGPYIPDKQLTLEDLWEQNRRGLLPVSRSLSGTTKRNASRK